jgi:hypothetical protein
VDGELENSNLALPEGSIAKRRGVKVMMVMMMKRKEGQEGYDVRPDEPQSRWCVNRTFSSFPNTLVTSLLTAHHLLPLDHHTTPGRLSVG